MCRMRSLLIGILAVLALGVGAGLARDSKSGDEYAGADTCSACHEVQAKVFKRSPHAAARLKAVPDASGCEACHGPGKAHAEDPTRAIFTFKKEPAGERSAKCLSCHAKHTKPVMSSGVHQRNGVSCDACHASGHGTATGPSLLREGQSALCVQCHASVNAQIELPFRHRIAEGIVRCSDCHDPHGRAMHMTGVVARDKACLRCHGEKQGPFTFEHTTVTVTGCLSCHVPHGSTNPKMLTRNQVMNLCLECHPDTTSYHNLSQGVFRNCTVCHTAIHGSYADRTLLR